MAQITYCEELKTTGGQVYCRIETDPGKDYLRITWRGFITDERAKKGLMKEKEAMKITKKNRFLIDNREQKGPFPQGITQWIEEVWMPEAMKLGFTKSAQILSENAFTELSSKQLEKNFENMMGNFATEEEALKWLAE